MAAVGEIPMDVVRKPDSSIMSSVHKTASAGLTTWHGCCEMAKGV